GRGGSLLVDLRPNLQSFYRRRHGPRDALQQMLGQFADVRFPQHAVWEIDAVDMDSPLGALAPAHSFVFYVVERLLGALEQSHGRLEMRCLEILPGPIQFGKGSLFSAFSAGDELQLLRKRIANH